MILRAAWVVPVGSAPIRDGGVRIESDRIVDVGPAADLSASDETAHLGDSILLPGFVNPHAHLELTCYADKIAAGPLWTWLERLVALRREPDAIERERQAVSDGAAQSLQAGVTCVGDISRLNIHWQPLKQSPIRKVCFVELLSIAREPPRDPVELRSAVAKIEEDALLTAGISPHAPYSVPEPHLRAAVALADELRRPWCAHWAETREEVAFLRGGRSVLPARLEAMALGAGVNPSDDSVLALLERCGQGYRSGGLAHVNYLDQREMSHLAAAGHVVLYCPRAHAYFGHDSHPVAELQSAGVKVALATDSLASNDSLSIRDEMRFLSRTRPDLSSADVLAMGTIDAASALGLEADIGSIEVGKQADLVAVDTCGVHVADPIEHAVSRAGAVAAVWVAGRRVI